MSLQRNGEALPSIAEASSPAKWQFDEQPPGPLARDATSRLAMPARAGQAPELPPAQNALWASRSFVLRREGPGCPSAPSSDHAYAGVVFGFGPYSFGPD